MFAKGKSLRRHQVHYRGPDTLHDVDFKERDSKRFAECGRPPASLRRPGTKLVRRRSSPQRYWRDPHPIAPSSANTEFSCEKPGCPPQRGFLLF